MRRKQTGWPWWTPAAALAASLVFSALVWAGLYGLSGVAIRFADAKVQEGQWSRQMVFDTTRQLTTGRSVSLKRDPTPIGSD